MTGFKPGRCVLRVSENPDSPVTGQKASTDYRQSVSSLSHRQSVDGRGPGRCFATAIQRDARTSVTNPNGISFAVRQFFSRFAKREINAIKVPVCFRAARDERGCAAVEIQRDEARDRRRGACGFNWNIHRSDSNGDPFDRVRDRFCTRSLLPGEL